MVLHFTFDENYMAPNSTWNLDRDDVFAVDLLCYEDIGLLRSQRNDEALKAVTDHLISKGASPNTQVDKNNSIHWPIIQSFVTVIITDFFLNQSFKHQPVLIYNYCVSMTFFPNSYKQPDHRHSVIHWYSSSVSFLLF